MPDEKTFQKRISYQGNLEVLLSKVCQDFNLGEYQSHKTITIGYEDLNIIVKTNKDKYLIKALANFRDNNDKQRYLDIMQRVNEAGIAHPKLYKSNQEYLHTITIDGNKVYLFVMQYIKGESFYDLEIKPNKEELKFLAKQAALINKIQIKPYYIYDDWAVVNFTKEYRKVKKHLKKTDLSLIEPLYKKFLTINLKELPHCFVHGDLLSSNIMKDERGGLWIIDFSVSNYYPRIQELAVLLCDVSLDKNKKSRFVDNYNLILKEYQKEVKLEKKELDLLPIYVKAAHAVSLIGSMKDTVKNGDSEENQYWLNSGRNGLKFTSKLWTD